jgi:hypothetical protein
MEKLNLNPDPRLEPAPGKTAFDYGVAVSQVQAIALPFLLPGVKLFDIVTAPLRGKRMSDWCEDLRLRLNDLSRTVEGLTPEKLATDEAFISVFAQATQAALKTHQKEKLEALRNAVLNVAVGTTLSEDLQTIFLNLVDSFTPKHLQTLTFFETRGPAMRDQLQTQRDLVDQAVTDLNSRGMIQDTRAYLARGRETSDCLINYEWKITPMGKQFLSFIREPTVKK